MFRYYYNTCSNGSGYTEDYQFNGCQLRANDANTDFALVELNETPASNSGIHYAGWNRNTTTPTSGTGIHHPKGDLMKISLDYQAPVSIIEPDYLPSTSPSAQYWKADFDVGIVQQSSSGSPLFDQNKRVVGQLYGNPWGECHPAYNTDTEYCWCTLQTPIGVYGKFNLSWIGGGTNSTRLSNWLDPNTTNLFTTNTTAVTDLVPIQTGGLVISGPDSICSSQSYTVNVPTGTTISFSVSVSPNSGYASHTVNGNEVTITRNGTNVGTAQITATVTDDCGNQHVVNKTVYLGPTPAFIMGPYDPVEHTVMGVACTGEQYYFAPLNIDPTATYTWKFIPPVWTQDWEPTYIFSGTHAYITMPDTARCYTLLVEKTNSCGGTVITQKRICVQECLGMRIVASPNPALTQLTVSIKDDKEVMSKQMKQENIQIELYDLTIGTRKKVWNFNATTQRQFNLNISEFSKGMYVVKVTKGSLQANTKIIKN